MQPLIPYFETPSIPISGEVGIHTFGVLVFIGFVVGQMVAERKIKKYGGDKSTIARAVSWMVLGTFVGGHLGHLLFYEPHLLAEDWQKLTFGNFRLLDLHIVQVWKGLSSFGGFMVCVPLAVWFFWKERKPFWPYGDSLAHGFAIGWFFGRMGCFSAHDHIGNPTTFWLGVHGVCKGETDPYNSTLACHDLGLYEALWSLATFGLFAFLDRKPRFPGFFVMLLPLLYGPFRFVSDFFRDDRIDVRYLGLTPAQYGSLLLTTLAIVLLVRRSKAAPAA